MQISTTEIPNQPGADVPCPLIDFQIESTAQGVRQHTPLLSHSPLSPLPLMCYQETCGAPTLRGNHFVLWVEMVGVLQITQLGGFKARPFAYNHKLGKETF